LNRDFYVSVETSSFGLRIFLGGMGEGEAQLGGLLGEPDFPIIFHGSPIGPQ
jgi:hypothetical protein